MYFIILILFLLSTISTHPFSLLEASGTESWDHDYMTFGIFDEPRMFLINKDLSKEILVLNPPTPHIVNKTLINLNGNCAVITKSYFGKNEQLVMVINQQSKSKLYVFEYKENSFNILLSSDEFVMDSITATADNNSIIVGDRDGSYIEFRNESNYLVNYKTGKLLDDNVELLDIMKHDNFTFVLGYANEHLILKVDRFSINLDFKSFSNCFIKSYNDTILVGCNNEIYSYLFNKTSKNLELEFHDTFDNRDWKGVETGNWLGNFFGQQFIVLRKNKTSDFEINLLVYGASLYYDIRKWTLTETLMQEQFSELEHQMPNKINVDQIKNWLTETNTNSFGFYVCDNPHEDSINNYEGFIRFLDGTNGFKVNGKYLRVWLELDPPTEAIADNCAIPPDISLTPFNETKIFGDSFYWNKTGYIAWGTIMGELSKIYPHLVALNIDDLTHDISGTWGVFTPTIIAQITAN